MSKWLALRAPQLFILVLILGVYAGFFTKQNAPSAQADGLDEHFLYLPYITRSPTGIVGRVTENGAPAGGIEVHLRGGLAGATTGSDGAFVIPDPPSLGPGQTYHVAYIEAPNPARMLSYETEPITAFVTGDTVDVGSFDIAGITLVTPEANGVVGLPATFQWIARPASPNDNYRFYIYLGGSNFPSFVSEPLGYTSSFTLDALPPNFQPGIGYYWEVRIGTYNTLGTPYGEDTDHRRIVKFATSAFNTLRHE
jgi:hypothetical protein